MSIGVLVHWSGILTVLVHFFSAALAAGQDTSYGQCRNPLYVTQWSGKNDIQTLLAFPAIKTNLKLCPAYNQQASCCHQTFESEQKKYFDFWTERLRAKLFRCKSHRDLVVASAAKLSMQDSIQREQYDAVWRRYNAVLSPNRHSSCLSALLAYVAGMVCFSCKSDWSRYAVFGSEGELVRIRIARSACLELWVSCKAFGHLAADLKAAIQDFAVARNVPVAEESFDMFMGQQQLCDWLHDEVALHPFKLLTGEDRNIPKTGLSTASRLLKASEREFDVLLEGRRSNFDLSWSGGPVSSRGARTGDCALMIQGMKVMAIALAWYGALKS